MTDAPNKLKISCGTVDCENGLHCYLRTKREAQKASRQVRSTRAINGTNAAEMNSSSEVASPKTAGFDTGLSIGDVVQKRATSRQCKACGVNLVDWERIGQRDIRDVKHTFQAMRTEWIRHYFWHVSIDSVAVDYAFRKGKQQLRERLAGRIRSAIGKSADQLFRDGAQTPLGTTPRAENIMYFAQHATASCCRKCVEEWHSIPRNRVLSNEDIEYLTDLGMCYILERLPTLPEDAAAVSTSDGE